MPFVNIQRAKQLVSFDVLGHNGAYISDIDFCMEYHDHIWVIGDVKGQEVTLPKGQMLFLHRFVDMARFGGKRAIAIIAEHNVWNWKEIIQLRECQVREYYTSETGRWAYPRRPYYVGEMIDQYIDLCEGGNQCNGQVASGLQKTG